MINIRFVIAIVYFAFNYHPWKISKSTNVNLSVYNENENINKTNHTFIDDDEFLKILRFIDLF